MVQKENFIFKIDLEEDRKFTLGNLEDLDEYYFYYFNQIYSKLPLPGS